MSLIGGLIPRDAAGRLIIGSSGVGTVNFNGGTPIIANGANPQYLRVSASVADKWVGGLGYVGAVALARGTVISHHVGGIPVDATGRPVLDISGAGVITHYAPGGIPLTAAGFIACSAPIAFDEGFSDGFDGGFQ